MKGCSFLQLWVALFNESIPNVSNHSTNHTKESDEASIKNSCTLFSAPSHYFTTKLLKVFRRSCATAPLQGSRVDGCHGCWLLERRERTLSKQPWLVAEKVKKQKSTAFVCSGSKPTVDALSAWTTLYQYGSIS